MRITGEGLNAKIDEVNALMAQAEAAVASDDFELFKSTRTELATALANMKSSATSEQT